jgi:hypothetical protein
MKRAKTWRNVVMLAFLLAGGSVFAQFDGFFTGYYAPSKWTTVLANNPQYQSTAFAQRQQGDKQLLISGAVSTQTTAQAPASIIDYTIVLDGTGLQPIAFGYLFNGVADGYDKAQLIYDNGSGLQAVAALSTTIGVQLVYNTLFQAGRTFGFRVYSNNDNVANTLVIVPIPEPSALTFLGLGLGALFWRLRRSGRR